MTKDSLLIGTPLPNQKGGGEQGADPGFAVYVHWPFCQAKCPYCDFNSHVRHGKIDEDRFRNAYLAELDHMAELTGPRPAPSPLAGEG